MYFKFKGKYLIKKITNILIINLKFLSNKVHHFLALMINMINKINL
jgi:hypothetical protein